MTPPRPSEERTAGAEPYEAQLARCILAGDGGAAAATALLEYSEPPTLRTAVAVVSRWGPLTAEAFDRVADAWETYRHLQHLTWD